LTAAGNPAITGVGRPNAGGRRFSLNWVGAVPFLAYVAIFLFLPTAIIIGGAFANDSGFTLQNFANLSRPDVVASIYGSIDQGVAYINNLKSGASSGSALRVDPGTMQPDRFGLRDCIHPWFSANVANLLSRGP